MSREERTSAHTVACGMSSPRMDAYSGPRMTRTASGPSTSATSRHFTASSRIAPAELRRSSAGS